jgi:tRNA nucleotidyltransferase/poly(A) polymerase
MISKELIPESVSRVTRIIQEAGFDAYIVGGCVRDAIRSIKPKDWDITTNAKPNDIISLFPHTFYDNNFGTVGIVNEDEKDETLKIIEVTTYRTDGEYSNSRHPDNISFSEKLEDDLKRRDFTVNAIAINPQNGEVIDLFSGIMDLKNGIIRAVGDANTRFGEDALRMLRAVRFSAELGFTIDPDTEKAIQNNAHLLKKISKERIIDEFLWPIKIFLQ